MANICTIPEKVFVTFRREGRGDDSLRLGFLCPATDDAAFKKRQHTMESWAYGHYRKVVDDKMIQVDTTYVIDPVTNQRLSQETTKVVDDDLQPAYYDNGLMEGFQIARSVRRYGWNGGNTVWRIADPRGFELEISSANFARIVDCTVIDKGVIEGRCVWGRSGSENILLPEDSDVYQEAKRETDRRATSVSHRDISPGDIVDLLSTSQWEGGTATYLGRFWVCGYNMLYDQAASANGGWGWHRSYREEPVAAGFAKAVQKYIYQLEDGTFVGGSSPAKVSTIIKKAETCPNPLETAQRLTGQKIAGLGYGNIWLAWPKKFDHTKAAFVIRKSLDQAASLEGIKNKTPTSRNGVVEIDGKLCAFGLLYVNEAEYSHRYRAIAVYLDNTADTEADTIRFTKNSSEVSKLFGGVNSYQRLREYEESELDSMIFYDLVVRVGDIEIIAPVPCPYSFSAH